MYYLYENSFMGKSFKKELDQRVTDVLKMIKLYYEYLINNNQFERLRDVFWKFLTIQINNFYLWSSLEVVQSHGIAMINEILGNNNILELIEENNKRYLGFFTLDKELLSDLSFLDMDEKLFSELPLSNFKKNIK